ncbi:MAG: hypothetical protein AAF942_07865 [Pseudomonadota bacterium]
MALSFFQDPMDPQSFYEADLANPAVLDLCSKVRLEHYPETAKPGQAWACRIVVRLADGRTFERTATDFRGSPTMPMTASEFRGKFEAATRRLGEERSACLYDGLQHLEGQKNLGDLLKQTAI